LVEVWLSVLAGEGCGVVARRHASAADFELVGMDDDPTPGDPTLIQAVLQRYSDIGDAAEKALNVLKKGGSIDAGRGSAMDALKKKIGDDLPDKLAKTVQSYHDAAQAYRDYIPRLQEAQDTFDRAVDQAQAAAPAADQTPPAPAADASDADKAAATKAQDSIDEGKSQVSAAKSLAEQAKSMRQTAQRACADVLDRAAKEAIPERNIFQKIADFFKDFPFVQILLGLLIAVVSVFFPVAGALLGGALFLVSEIPAIASGNFSLGDLLTGLIGLVPGGALLKAGGGLVKAGVGAAVKSISKGAKGVEGSLSGVGTSLNSSKAIGGLLNNSGVRAAGSVVKDAAKDAGEETINQAVNGQGFDPTAIATAGVLGVGGAGLKGIGKKFAPPKGGSNQSTTTRTRGPGPGEAGPSGTQGSDDARTPPPDPTKAFPPVNIKPRPGGGPLDFEDKKFPDIHLVLHRTDPDGFDPAVFKVKGTENKVFFDIEENKFKKFEGGKFTDEDADFSRVDRPGQGQIPTDHFVAQGFEGANLRKVELEDDFTELSASPTPVLVKTSLLQNLNLRGDPDPVRLDSIKSAIGNGTPLPPIDVSAGSLNINQGNHRIIASGELGLPFVPTKISGSARGSSASAPPPSAPIQSSTSVHEGAAIPPSPGAPASPQLPDAPPTTPVSPSTPTAPPPTPVTPSPQAPLPVPPNFSRTKTPFDFDQDSD
jgi:hypothetical protein